MLTLKEKIDIQRLVVINGDLLSKEICSIYINVNLNEETVEGVPELLKNLEGLNIGLDFSLVFKSLGACKT